MAAVGELLAALDLEPAGERGRFRAHNVGGGPGGPGSAGGVVFGGQLLAQTLVAAARTVPDKDVLSLHTVFCRGGAPAWPFDVTVDVVHAGRTFATATVTMAQGNRTCTRSEVLLHAPGADLIRHADPAPDVPPPEEVPPRATAQPFEVRIVGDVDLSDPEAVGPAELRVWCRFPGAPDDPLVSQALLAYASDGFLIGTAMRPHSGIGQSLAHTAISTTVLNQTLSFHEPFHAGDWLLLDQRSPYAGRGRSHGTAGVYSADGRLVASFGQDNMIRDFPAGMAPPPGYRAEH